MSCDAMGKIVNNYKEKDILYYELVCRNPVPKKPNFPIAGLLSTGQSEDEIKILFSTVQDQAKSLAGKKDWKPQEFMSDRSLAIMNPALEIFNDENLSSYIGWLFVFLQGKSPFRENKTILQLCSVHHLRNNRDNLKSKEPSNTRQKSIVYASSCIAAATSLEEYHTRMHFFFILCLSRHNCAAVMEAKAKFNAFFAKKKYILIFECRCP